jgi:hypothetical protein
MNQTGGEVLTGRFWPFKRAQIGIIRCLDRMPRRAGVIDYEGWIELKCKQRVGVVIWRLRMSSGGGGGGGLETHVREK